MSLTGDPDGPPYRAGISVFDVMAGLHATIGVLAALHRREDTGRGQHVEVNLLSSALSGLVNHSSAYVAAGHVPYRMGNAHPSLFPYEPLPCADGDLIITAGNDGQFRRLCEVLGLAELVDDPRFARNQDRTANRDQLRPLLVAKLAQPDEAGVVSPTSSRPACPAARSTRSTPGWPSPRRSAWIRWSRSAAGSSIPSIRNPITLSRHPAGYRYPRRHWTSTVHRSGTWLGRTRRTDDWPRMRPGVPDLVGYLRCRPHPAARSSTLPHDLMGQVGFGELAFWLVALRRPTPSEVRVFEAVLVALADHGFTPTAIAARLTYLSAPDSLQGALAAGLLGGGSRFLGVTEDCGAFLHAALAERAADLPTDDAGWDALALETVPQTRAAGRFVPGLGHPVHKVEDPRTPVLIRIADEEGLRGPHLRLFEAIGRVHEQVLGRRLPLNGAGVCGAALADLGLPVELLRGFALLARAAGLLGQLAEERRRPIGMDVYRAVDGNADYVRARTRSQD